MNPEQPIPKEIQLQESRPEAQKGKHPARELINQYLAGELHGHSDFSNPPTRHEADYSVEEFAQYARERIDKGTGKFSFLALAEHPSDAGKPERVSGERILAHKARIDKLSQELKEEGEAGPKILAGVECSLINKNGELDLDDRTLDQLDLVIASRHAFPKLEPEELTQVYLKVLENPNVDIFGHPSRHLGKDYYSKMDWDKIFETAVKNDVAIELNLNAMMPKELIERAAKVENLKLAIGTDFHVFEQYRKLPQEIQDELGELAEARKLLEKCSWLPDNLSKPLTGLELETVQTLNEGRQFTVEEQVVWEKLINRGGEGVLTEIQITALEKKHSGEKMSPEEQVAYRQARDTQIYTPEELEILRKMDLCRTGEQSEELKEQERKAKLKYPLGVRFWLKMTRLLKILDELGVEPERIINSSNETLESWLKERESRK